MVPGRQAKVKRLTVRPSASCTPCERSCVAPMRSISRQNAPPPTGVPAGPAPEDAVASSTTGWKRRSSQVLSSAGATELSRRNMSLKSAGSGEVMEKPSARNAGGLPWHSVQMSSSCRMRLCSRPCVQLKKCARPCTLSEASRLSTIDSICRKSVAEEPASPCEDTWDGPLPLPPSCASGATAAPCAMICTDWGAKLSVDSVRMDCLCLCAAWGSWMSVNVYSVVRQYIHVDYIAVTPPHHCNASPMGL